MSVDDLDGIIGPLAVLLTLFVFLDITETAETITVNGEPVPLPDPTIFLWIPIAVVGLFGLIIAIAWVGSLYDRRKRYAFPSTGIFADVEHEHGINHGSCFWCGSEDYELEGVETSYRQDRVVLGFVVETLDEGSRYDCKHCWEDPIEGQLRRERLEREHDRELELLDRRPFWRTP